MEIPVPGKAVLYLDAPLVGTYIIYCPNVMGSPKWHYNDVILGAMASQIISLTIVFSTVYLDTDQRKHQSSATLAFVRRIHRRPVNSPHKWPVTRKMFPFDDVFMDLRIWLGNTTVTHHLFQSDLQIYYWWQGPYLPPSHLKPEAIASTFKGQSAIHSTDCSSLKHCVTPNVRITHWLLRTDNWYYASFSHS